MHLSLNTSGTGKQCIKWPRNQLYHSPTSSPQLLEQRISTEFLPPFRIVGLDSFSNLGHRIHTLFFLLYLPPPFFFKNSWDKVYDREVSNFEDHGDIGEIWYVGGNELKVKSL